MPNETMRADSGSYPLKQPSEYNLKEFSSDSKIPRRNLPVMEKVDFSVNDLTVYYVTDIHLEFKILEHFKTNALSEDAIRVFIKQYVKKAFKKYQDKSGIFLFGGDIANDISLVRLFFEEVIIYIQPRRIVALLGNHEFWSTSHGDFEKSVKQYREMFRDLGILLAQNDLVLYENGKLYFASEEEVLESTKDDLRKTCSSTPLIILGGLGFSGCNKNFNTSIGLYSEAISTEKEDLEQTKRFKKLYDKVHECLSDYPVLVFTHMPVENWSESAEYEPNWIYVNGHTHINNAISDGNKRVYSDNQIGYHRKSLDFHCFTISYKHDIFRYLSDGIYKISNDQYCSFNWGLGISMQYSRDWDIYMLKRSEIYCFFSKNQDKICLMDGGMPHAVEHGLDYYYNNLEQYCLMMIEASESFRNKLKEISDSVKLFGGSGNIHGSIIDIDAYNHIFLNPVDGKITPYYATDIKEKYVFASVGHLIKDMLPTMYPKYLKASGMGRGQLILNDVPLLEEDTSIYALSKKAKAIQYMSNFKIVRYWDDTAYRNNVNSKLLCSSLMEITDISSKETEEDGDEASSDLIMEYVCKAIDATIEWQLDYSEAVIDLKLKSEIPNVLKITAPHVGKRAKILYGIDEIYGIDKKKINSAVENEIIRFRRQNDAS